MWSFNAKPGPKRLIQFKCLEIEGRSSPNSSKPEREEEFQNSLNKSNLVCSPTPTPWLTLIKTDIHYKLFDVLDPALILLLHILEK